MISFRSGIVATVLLSASVFPGTDVAFAKDKDETRVTGVVVAVDRASRTMVVRDSASGERRSVHIPKGRTITLSRNGNAIDLPQSLSFERVQRGLYVNMEIESEVIEHADATRAE